MDEFQQHTKSHQKLESIAEMKVLALANDFALSRRSCLESPILTASLIARHSSSSIPSSRRSRVLSRRFDWDGLVSELQHVSVISELSRLVDERILLDVSELEQEMAASQPSSELFQVRYPHP